MADLEKQIFEERQKKVSDMIAAAGEDGASPEVVNEMQKLIDQLSQELEKKTSVVDTLQEDKAKINAEKASKLKEVAKEFDKLQRQQKKDTQKLNEQIKKLEKQVEAHKGKGGRGPAAAEAKPVLDVQAKVELAKTKQEYEKKLKAAEKKVEMLEKKLKSVQG